MINSVRNFLALIGFFLIGFPVCSQANDEIDFDSLAFQVIQEINYMRSDVGRYWKERFSEIRISEDGKKFCDSDPKLCDDPLNLTNSSIWTPSFGGENFWIPYCEMEELFNHGRPVPECLRLRAKGLIKKTVVQRIDPLGNFFNLEVEKITGPLPLLTIHGEISKASEDHAKALFADSAKGNHPEGDHIRAHQIPGEPDLVERVHRYLPDFLAGAFGENVAFGFKNARRMIVLYLLDVGIPSRGHRIPLIDSSFTFVGSACGPFAYPTSDGNFMIPVTCVQDFTSNPELPIRDTLLANPQNIFPGVETLPPPPDGSKTLSFSATPRQKNLNPNQEYPYSVQMGGLWNHYCVAGEEPIFSDSEKSPCLKKRFDFE